MTHYFFFSEFCNALCACGRTDNDVDSNTFMASKRKHVSSFSRNILKLLQKRFKHGSTLIERLPNELFLEIFNYLSDVDVVYAFSQLNIRFQCLILDYCHTFDFKSVSKAKLKFVIREHNTQQWRALRLSDDDDTPGQITLFSQLFPIAKFVPQLHALSLINMKLKTAQFLIPQMKIFTHLVSLTIGNVCGKDLSGLELPSLKYLIINSCRHSKWMKNIRQLESLEHIIEDNCIHEHHLIWPNELKQLKIFYTRVGDSEIVYASLRHLSQLTNLAVYDNAWSSPPPDGQRWEKLIVSSLPLLVNFQFVFKFLKDAAPIGDINRIISTFATPFYLEEKHWFVRCDAHCQQFSSALLYSLPFAFECFEIITHSFHESVSTLDMNSTTNFNQNIYSKVKTLVAEVKCNKLDPGLTKRNVKHLILKFSGTSADWLFSMNHLRQLSLGSRINMTPKDFARLLKNLPWLNSLIASYPTLKRLTNYWKNTIVCEQLSYKIQSLNLCSIEYVLSHIQDYVRVDELVHIVRIFGRRCQHLTITVYSRNVVAGLLLRSMKRLRSLKVILKEHDNMKITKDWLKEQDVTLKDLDYSVIINDNEYSFWFDNRY